MIKVIFIINSTRKRSPLAKKAIFLAQASKELQCFIRETEYPNHACEIALSEAQNSDVLVAVGGDGTFNEVLQGLIDSKENTKLGLIPNGTGNDFSRMLPDFDPKKFVNALEQNQSKPIDIGCCSIKDKTRYFINISDIGFGAEVVRLLTKQRSRNIGGKISYSLAIVRAFLSYKKRTIKVEGDGIGFEGKILMVAFCNGGTFGHGLTINPDASLNSGKLNVTVVGNVSLMTYIKNLGKLKRGEKIIHPEAHYFESKEIIISNPNSEMIWMEGDGELFGEGPSQIAVLPNRINLIG